jgi:hypothetical protein
MILPRRHLEAANSGRCPSETALGAACSKNLCTCGHRPVINGLIMGVFKLNAQGLLRKDVKPNHLIAPEAFTETGDTVNTG